MLTTAAGPRSPTPCPRSPKRWPPAGSSPGAITEKTIQKYLDEPDLPDVDLFLRSSGEQRLSNFMLWQSAYAEFVFLDTLWPDVDRRTLWDAVEIYAQRDRRYGGAVDAAPPTPQARRAAEECPAGISPAAV